MPLKIIKEDTLSLSVDVIVNSTNSMAKGFSGPDAIIHMLGGDALKLECEKFSESFEEGEYYFTRAYNLPSKNIIHLNTYNWQCDDPLEIKREKLYQNYYDVVKAAILNGYMTVSVPVLASGNKGCPVEETVIIGKKAILNVLHEIKNKDAIVYFCIFGVTLNKIKSIIPETILKQASNQKKDYIEVVILSECNKLGLDSKLIETIKAYYEIC